MRHSRESSCFCPWKANTGQSWLVTALQPIQKGRSFFHSKEKYYLFLSSNNLEKKPQEGILKAYMKQKGQKPISDLLKTSSRFFQMHFFIIFFFSNILGQSGSLLDSQTSEFNFSKTFDCVGFLFAPLFSLRLYL